MENLLLSGHVGYAVQVNFRHSCVIRCHELDARVNKSRKPLANVFFRILSAGVAHRIHFLINVTKSRSWFNGREGGLN